MSEIRLITSSEIIKNTPLDSNVDYNSYSFIIDDIQIMYLEPILGTNLYEKIQEDYNTNSLAGLYLKIHEDYIKPYLCRAVFADYSSNGKYRIRNNGNIVHVPENGRPNERSEDDKVVQNYLNKAETYLTRLNKFLCVEGNNIPEYKTQDNSYDQKPKENNGQPFNWYLK